MGLRRPQDACNDEISDPNNDVEDELVSISIILWMPGDAETPVMTFVENIGGQENPDC